jgi:hypothetical protein
LGTIDNLRGVDGILLAEALAGSTLQAQLLDVYAREEAALTHLSMMYDTWLTTSRLHIEIVSLLVNSFSYASGHQSGVF